MKRNTEYTASIVNTLIAAYQQLCLFEALRPAGGTRYRGSAHPKLPACGRAGGVARNLRKTPWQEWRTSSKLWPNRVRYVP